MAGTLHTTLSYTIDRGVTKRSEPTRKRSNYRIEISEEKLLEIQLTRQLAHEMRQAYEAGETYDIDSASERTGLYRQEVAELFDLITQQNDLKNQEVVLPPGEERYLLSVPEPSKENKERFLKDIESNGLFSIDTSDRIRDFYAVSTKNKFAKKLAQFGLVDLIVEPFRDYCRDHTNLLVNGFFYLLCLYGDRWISVRSYYVTLYKWFSHYFYMDLEDPEEMEDFSRLIDSKLRRLAVCQIERSPDFDQRSSGKFTIRATPFFQRFITLSSRKSLH